MLARELGFVPPEGLRHVFLVLQLIVDGHSELANMNSGYCTKGTFLSLELEPHEVRGMESPWKGLVFKVT